MLNTTQPQRTTNLRPRKNKTQLFTQECKLVLLIFIGYKLSKTLLFYLLRYPKTRKQIFNSTRPTFEQFSLLTIRPSDMHSSVPGTRFRGRKHALLRGRCIVVGIQTLLCYASDQGLCTETRGLFSSCWRPLLTTLGKQRKSQQLGDDSPLPGLESKQQQKIRP